MKNFKKMSQAQWLMGLIIVVVIGLVGWLAYAAVNSTANWTTYSNSAGKYSLKYPKSWAHLECSSGAELLLAANAQSLGACDNAGQRIVVYAAGDGRSQ